MKYLGYGMLGALAILVGIFSFLALSFVPFAIGGWVAKYHGDAAGYATTGLVLFVMISLGLAGAFYVQQEIGKPKKRKKGTK